MTLAQFEVVGAQLADLLAEADRVAATLGLPEGYTVTLGTMEPATVDYQLWCALVTVQS